MDIETLKEIQNIKKELKAKLKEVGKDFRWFWENHILQTGLVYNSFMGSLNGNGGKIRKDVEENINKYLEEKF